MRNSVKLQITITDREAHAIMGVLHYFIEREYRNVKLLQIAKDPLIVKFNVAVNLFQHLEQKLKVVGSSITDTGLILPPSK